MNVSGCEDCRRSTAGRCSLHNTQPFSPFGGVALAESVAHRHVWHYDGINGAYYLYHCDDHDPPVVRQIWYTDAVPE